MTDHLSALDQAEAHVRWSRARLLSAHAHIDSASERVERGRARIDAAVDRVARACIARGRSRIAMGR